MKWDKITLLVNGHVSNYITRVQEIINDKHLTKMMKEC